MLDFEILKPERIQSHQEAQQRKEITYVGGYKRYKGQKIWGYSENKMFEIKPIYKAMIDINGKTVVRGKVTLKPDTVVVFAINKNNAIKKLKKNGIINC